MENFLIYLQATISILTLLGVLYAIYRTFSDPDIKAKGRLDIMEGQCQLKHSGLDKAIYEIKTDLKMVKENHLKHIENRLGNIEKTQERILTILEYEKKHS